MRVALVSASILAIIACSTAASASAPPIDPGPQPSWQEATQLGNQAIIGRMIDPDSARISWPYSFFGGSLKGLFSKREAGWITCGMVNAKNRMGGYTGAEPFLIVIRDRQVVELDIGESDGIDAASATCPNLIKKGLIHASGAPDQPAPVAQASIEQMAAAGAVAAAKQGGIGIVFVSSGAGLVLIAVAPGSAAATAGLKPGEVIQSANGTDLRNMPQVGAIAVLHALSRPFQFELAGGTKVTIGK